MARPLQVLIIFAVAAFVGLLAYGIAAQAPDGTIDDDLSRGRAKAAPALSLPVLSEGTSPSPVDRVIRDAARDGRIDLRELRGSPVVVNFWASWCEPCRAEASLLEAGWKRAAPRGVVFLGVDQQDASGDARRFIRRYRTSYPNIREAGRDAGRRYGTTGLPETFFISAKGQVVGHVPGALDARQLREGVAAAVAGRPIAAAPGGAAS